MPSGRDIGDAVLAEVTPQRQRERQAELLNAWTARFHKPLLHFFRRRMPSDAECEDLVQDVFLRLARRDDLHLIDHVDGYLFETAANILKDWRRKQLTHAADAHEEIGEEVMDVGASPERVLLSKDNLRVVLDALESLPERTRMVFALYHFEHRTHAEIGRRLGIAIRTVEDHMARANARLLAAYRDLVP